MQKKHTSQPTKTEASSSTGGFQQRPKTAPSKNGTGSSREQSFGPNLKALIDSRFDSTWLKLNSLEMKQLASNAQMALLLDASVCQNKSIMSGAARGRIVLWVLSTCVFIQFAFICWIAISNGLL
jgi:hypothetical protein